MLQLKQYASNLVYAVYGLDASVCIVGEFADFQAAKPRLATGGGCIMMEEIPFAIIFHDAVVGSPANYRCQYHTLICERSIGIVADGITKQMAVAGAI